MKKQEGEKKIFSGHISRITQTNVLNNKMFSLFGLPLTARVLQKESGYKYYFV
jgi:hypothetical protein